MKSKLFVKEMAIKTNHNNNNSKNSKKKNNRRNERRRWCREISCNLLNSMIYRFYISI